VKKEDTGCGSAAIIPAPTSVADFETTVHGSRYPVNPNPSVTIPISIPTTHMSSLGFLWTETKYPRIMCMNASMIMA
jgi:hypothetical protein